MNDEMASPKNDRAPVRPASRPAGGRSARVGPVPLIEPLEGRTLFDGSPWDLIDGTREGWRAFFTALAAEREHDEGDDDGGDGGDDGGRGKGDHGDDGDDDDDDDHKPNKPNKPGKGSKKDSTPPVASLVARDLEAAGGRSHTAVVTFTDDRKVKASTITPAAFSVAGPSGQALEIRSVTIAPMEDAGSITAAVTFDAPGGTWNADDNGQYTVRLNGGAVTDTRRNAAEPRAATFDVNIARPAPAPADTAAPQVATAVSTSVTRTGTAAHTLSVTYRDDRGLDLASINARDVTVTGPRGPVDVRVVSVGAGGGEGDDSREVTAVYGLAPPQGAWDAADNGTYTVSINGDQVRDAAGNFVAAGTVATFEVRIAPPATVDPDYGGGNTPAPAPAPRPPALPPFVGEAAVTLADGSVIVAGRVGDLAAGTARGALQRFNAAGRLDPNFGTRGVVAAPLGGGKEGYFAVVLQGDRILVAGTSGGEFLLARYDAAGRPDATFGRGGRVVTDVGGGDDAAYAVALGPDGKIVAAGRGGDGNVAFARYDADGRPDALFGQGGRQLFDLGSAADVAGAVAVLGDGKVLAVGSAGDDVAVIRLRADGEADGSFSGDGLRLIDGLSANGGGPDHSQGLAIQGDGKILLVNHTAAGDFAVTRLNAAGERDATFGDGGLATVDFGGDDDADAVLLQPDGDILVLGTSAAGGGFKTAVAALDRSGALVTSFGEGGKLLLDASEPSPGRELHVGDLVVRAFGTRQPDGSVVVGTGGSTPRGVQENTSPLRRLVVPGTRVQPQGTRLGDFGLINGRQSPPLVYTDADGTTATLTLRGGNGTAFASGGRINLALADGGRGMSLTVRTSNRTGGDGRFALGDVTISGSVRGLVAPGCDLAGTLAASGSLGRLSLGTVAGTVAAGGAITSLRAAELTNARVLSGTLLGADGQLGGDAADADSFAAGSIGVLRVSGSITGSLIAAGLDPADGTFLNGDDRVTGGEDSVIRSIAAGEADGQTRFVSGKFGRTTIGGRRAEVTTDARFVTFQPG